MVTFSDGSEYIAEERRQIVRAIHELKRRMSAEAGKPVSFEMAKNRFFSSDFNSFAVSFRVTHNIR